MNTTKVNWLLDASNPFEENTNKLLAEEIERQGMTVKLVQHRAFEEGFGYLNAYDKSACVVFYGSLKLGQAVRYTAEWVPGAYYDKEAYACTRYYPPLHDFLLNKRSVMIPYGELLAKKDFLYETLGQDDALFIRPNSGYKLFTGKLVLKENYEKDIDAFNFDKIKPYELCVVGEPRNIDREWRFVCVNKKIVAGSQYQANGQFAMSPDFPDEAFHLADKVAQRYEPNIAWCIDICRTTDGEYHLLEIGCFSCAGLYACDRGAVVREVSAAALKEWEDYQNP